MYYSDKDTAIELKKSFYNKTKVAEDGVTHIVDTEHSYTVYQFCFAKNYFNSKDEADLFSQIASDLRNFADELERKSKNTISKESETTQNNVFSKRVSSDYER